MANDKNSNLPLAKVEACAHMQRVLRGELSPDEIRQLLVAYNDRAATSDELAGFLQAVREAATPIDLPAEIAGRAVDIVGTGGDGSHTFNISTCSMFVAAAAGAQLIRRWAIRPRDAALMVTLLPPAEAPAPPTSRLPCASA